MSIADDPTEPRPAPPLRGVLFDATGTLIETREPVGEVYARFAREYGVELGAWRLGDAFRRVLSRAPKRAFCEAAPGEIEALERQWWREIVRMTFQATDSTVIFDDFDSLFAALFDHYASADAWTLRAGACEMLAELRERGLRIGLVSNFDHRINKILQELLVAEYFDSITTPGNCQAEKPDPRIFEFALAKLGLKADEVVYVGNDPEKDISGARSAGLRAIDASGVESLERIVDELASLPPAASGGQAFA